MLSGGQEDIKNKNDNLMDLDFSKNKENINTPNLILNKNKLKSTCNNSMAIEEEGDLNYYKLKNTKCSTSTFNSSGVLSFSSESNLTNLNNQNNSNNFLIYSDKQNFLNLNSNFLNFNFSSEQDKFIFVYEYLNEIYNNLLLEEKNISLINEYMKNQEEINEQMRAILVDWLIEVHYNFQLRPQTLYICIQIIDNYLNLIKIKRTKLQLLGITALLIACKYNEIYYPGLKDFIEITDRAYEIKELLKFEKDVLRILNYNIVKPTALDFYEILSKSYNFNSKQYFLGRYFMESTLIDYRMLKYKSSTIACTCAYLVMKFFGLKNYQSIYNKNLSNSSSDENSQKLIKETARKICFLIKNLATFSLKSLKEKYNYPPFENITSFCDKKDKKE